LAALFLCTFLSLKGRWIAILPEQFEKGCFFFEKEHSAVSSFACRFIFVCQYSPPKANHFSPNFYFCCRQTISEEPALCGGGVLGLRGRQRGMYGNRRKKKHYPVNESARGFKDSERRKKGEEREEVLSFSLALDSKRVDCRCCCRVSLCWKRYTT